ncbi:hypothetical protein [Streptomyces longispororuber]|uniref:hypothetical protein n=1 Tax=Streptomyces longispororuber TaxID=68230 RepID=UPI0036F722BB
MTLDTYTARRTGGRTLLRRAAVALTGAGAALGLAMAPASAAAGGWEPVPDPDSINWVDAVLPAADGTVFARGGYYPQGDPGSGEFSTYWQRDGASWKKIPTPKNQSLDTYGDDLWTATSAKDLWVVGSMAATPSIVNHWNGTAWQDRSPADKTVEFKAVKAVAPNDVWAVGETTWRSDRQTQQGVIGHWNGTAWKITKLPQATNGHTSLGALQVLSANDVWAAGKICTIQDARTCRGYVTHYDGTAWKEVAVPQGTIGVNELTASPSGQVWAAAGTTVLRRTGGTWDTSASVNLPSVYGVTELTWVKGTLYAGLGQNQPSKQTGVLRWTGSAWESVTSPYAPKSEWETIAAVTSLTGGPDGSLWATGTSYAFFATGQFASRLPAGATR